MRGKGSKRVDVSHLLFADDALIFCKASKDDMTRLGWLLMCFKAISSLKINLEKSELFLVGSGNDAKDLAFEVACKVGSLPSTYLGLPLGVAFKSVEAWDGIEERIRRRLAMWKRLYISKGGKMILIQSTLASLPIYFMSLFPNPRSVRMRFERIQRNFVWGGCALERRPQLVNSEVVCRDKKSGGLGIKKLSILNKALLCKWSWRFMQETDARWNVLIRVKCGEDQGGWCTKMVRARHGVGVWKELRKGWELGGGKMVFEVGNGSRVLFWKDERSGSMALCDAFPNLFVVVAHKDAVSKEMWSPNEGGGC